MLLLTFITGTHYRLFGMLGPSLFVKNNKCYGMNNVIILTLIMHLYRPPLPLKPPKPTAKVTVLVSEEGAVVVMIEVVRVADEIGVNKTSIAVATISMVDSSSDVGEEAMHHGLMVGSSSNSRSNQQHTCWGANCKVTLGCYLCLPSCIV